MKKRFVCSVCGYIYEGAEAPEECPVCHAKGKFQEFTTAQLKGTKTEQNLKTAFAGESQAHTKYLYFASKAKKEGYEQIGGLFEETAHNEREHAEMWFKFLHEGGIPTLQTLLLVKTMSGLTCMLKWLKRLWKKVLLVLPLSSVL